MYVLGVLVESQTAPETSSLVKLRVFPPITIAKLARGLVPFDDPNWLFELKHDGFRSLAFIENNRCRLVSRHRNTYKSFETLADDLSRLRAKTAILDGEIVCLDSEGVSQFKELLYRRGRAVFFAFDLLWLNDAELRRTPLIERKKKLKQLIQRSECSEIIYAQHVEHRGKLLFEEVCERNLEGIVGKRKSSFYVEHGWVKIKNPNYTQGEGRHEMFTAFHERRKKPKSVVAGPRLEKSPSSKR